MVEHKYGEFADLQISEAKKYICKRVFFLLLVAEDLETRENFPDVSLPKAHKNVLWYISGLNDLLLQPPCVVHALSLLEEAYNNLISENFDFKKYRKLILDTCAEINHIAEPTVKGGDC